jgi:glycosyltransferase A (GT-A) superfamily protein (DUF2064 family)
MKGIKEFSTTTAILLFAQSEKVQSATKPIAYQEKQNRALWRTMNEKVLRTIQKTNLPYFISDETNQVGNTFGQKITHSIQLLFEQGFDSVIVLGNDCLELQPQQVLEASHKLQTNDVVLGADFNGGAYLIGLSKSVFEAARFEKISWQTNSVFKELQTLFWNTHIALLAHLHDANSNADFKKAVHKLSFSNPFRNLILSLLQKKAAINQGEIPLVSYEFKELNFNKGSPFWV